MWVSFIFPKNLSVVVPLTIEIYYWTGITRNTDRHTHTHTQWLNLILYFRPLRCKFYPRERWFNSIFSLYPGVSGYQFYWGNFQWQTDVLFLVWREPPVCQTSQKSENGTYLIIYGPYGSKKTKSKNRFIYKGNNCCVLLLLLREVIVWVEFNSISNNFK